MALDLMPAPAPGDESKKKSKLDLLPAPAPSTEQAAPEEKGILARAGDFVLNNIPGKDEIPTYGGAMLGAEEASAAGAPITAAATAMGGPLLGVPTGLAIAAGGAFLGGAAGKGLQKGAEALQSGQGQPIKKQVGEMAQAGSEMAQAEALGRAAISPVLSKGMKVAGAAGQIFKEGTKATAQDVALASHYAMGAMSDATRDAIIAMQKAGVPLTYGQISQTSISKFFERMTRSNPLTQGAIEKFDIEANKAYSRAAESLSNSLTRGRENLASSLEAGKSAIMGSLDQGTRAIQDRIQNGRSAILETLGKPQETGTIGAATKMKLEENLAQADASRLMRYNESIEDFKKRVNPSGKAIPSSFDERVEAAKVASKLEQKEDLTLRKGLFDKARALTGDPKQVIDVSDLRNKVAPAIVSSYPETGAKEFRGKAYSIADQYRNPKMPAELEGMHMGTLQKISENPALLQKDLPMSALKGMDIQTLTAVRQNPALMDSFEKSKGMTIDDIQNEIKHLGDMIEDGRRPDGTVGIDGKNLGTLKKSLQDTLDNHFSKENPEAQKAYAVAKQFHAGFSEKFNNKTVAKLYGDDPATVFDQVVRNGTYRSTKTLARALGPDGEKILKRQMLDELFGSGKEIPTKGELIEKMDKMSSGIRALFSDEDKAWIKRMAEKGQTPPFVQGEYDRIARNMIKNSPEQISKNMLSGNADFVRAGKKYLPPEMVKVYARMEAEDLLSAANGKPSGVIDNINKRSNEYLREYFPQSVIDGMKKIGQDEQLLARYNDLKTARVNAYEKSAQKQLTVAEAASDAKKKLLEAQAKSVGVGGKIAPVGGPVIDGQHVQTAQFGMGGLIGITGLYLHPMGLLNAKTGATVLLAHPVIAHLYTSELGQKFLTTLLRMPETDPRLPNLLAEAAAYAYRTGAKKEPAQ
jgi:hypothetical protein